MITRRSMNRVQSAPAIKTLEDYLKEQESLLDNVAKVLGREFEAVKNRQLDELEAIAEEKSSLMLQVQSNDQRLKLHPNSSELKTKYINRVESIKAKLKHCKTLNETNGKLINLSLAATNRLMGVLMEARDRLSSNMTYTDKGQTVATSPKRVDTNV